MGSKKIIAICQYGGEFEVSKDGYLSYHGGEAYAVALREDALLTDFKQDLADTFECSVDDKFIKYFLPGNKKTLITISKDKDIKRMFDIFNDSDQVEIFLVSSRGAGVVNDSRLPVSRLSRTTVSEEAVVAVASTSHTIEPLETIIPNETDSLDVVINETTPVGPCSSINETTAEGHCTSICDDKRRKVATQWENTITGVDQRFSSILEFRQALHKYSIAHGFTYKFMSNDRQRVRAKCTSEGCPWYIYAARLANTRIVCIKKMRPNHTCEGATTINTGHRLKAWVVSIVAEKLKDSPNYKPVDIANDIKREYGIELNYKSAWRARELAMGSYQKAYTQLPFFCEKIIETNPGSLATFTTNEDSSFHRLFVSFHASISGFQHCRPLLFLDSLPLNSKYRGTLLAATAADGDDAFFPVAFAVVNVETDENWRWFLMELKSIVATSLKITFVADFQKGIRESLTEVFSGQCYHGYCLNYLTEKLNKDLKGQFSHEARRLMVQDVYAAARAPTVKSFEECAENIKSILPEAYKWLVSYEPEHWANAFFQGARYNHRTSNFGLLFYSLESGANELPITQMIDVLRGKMMELIHTRRVDSSKWRTWLTPTMEEKLRDEAFKAELFQVLPTQGSTYEVRSESVDIVNIDNWDCTCKGWQLSGLPCCHAVAVLKKAGKDPYDYCSPYFTAECFRKTYAESIHPVPNIEAPLNEVPITVTPPFTKRAPGRPRMKPDEEIIKRPMQCSNCKELGHNKRRCKVK